MVEESTTTFLETIEIDSNIVLVAPACFNVILLSFDASAERFYLLSFDDS
jgi:hypothetical protein